jgi:hypothetical protein
MRRIPGSLLLPVRFTCAGRPWRSSAHLRISSWSVVTLLADGMNSPFALLISVMSGARCRAALKRKRHLVPLQV